jgi:HYDIN/CFA65/VesB-like, Ig-like domain/Abnormal spindle-like microcephaly-assoc'd, ASPM-SPD-2-Hydin
MHLDPLKGIADTAEGLLRAVGSQPMAPLLVVLVVTIATAGSLGGCAITSTPAKPFAALSVSPSDVDFGRVKTGSNASRVIRISDPGQVGLTITGAALSGNGFGTDGLVFPVRVQAGGDTTFTVVFVPTSTGAASGRLELTTSAGMSPISVSLTGIGVADAAPQLTVRPSSLDFGNVQTGNRESENTTLTNTGTSDITISVVTIAGLGYNISGVVQGQTLTSGQSLPVTVTFTPTASGSAEGSISIADSASTPPAVIYLSGGAHLVSLSWSPSPTTTVIGYNVYRLPMENGSYAIRLNSNLVSGTAFTDTSVAAGQTYSYVVTAVDSSGVESGYSDAASATIPTP